jgi:hypothetical protein
MEEESKHNLTYKVESPYFTPKVFHSFAEFKDFFVNLHKWTMPYRITAGFRG